MKCRIILTDNLNRDNPPSDIIVAENIRSFNDAYFMAEALNKRYGNEYGSMYYKAVNDDYKLHIFDGY